MGQDLRHQFQVVAPPHCKLELHYLTDLVDNIPQIEPIHIQREFVVLKPEEVKGVFD